MTDHRPPVCDYDRTTKTRVVRREHRDDCQDPALHHGCAPCTAPHCGICGRGHVDNDHPQTCPECVGKIRTDLADLVVAYDDLALEAIDGARAGGRLMAAAPIPGGDAQVLRGPSTTFDQLVLSRTSYDDHHHADPLPPLGVLAPWEDYFRVFLGLGRPPRRTLGSVVEFLTVHLTGLAQDVDLATWVRFTRELRAVRAGLERVLHDERQPELGVECFECGDRLVRRFHPPTRCTHPTPARREFRRWLGLGYLEAISPSMVRAARRPCGRPGCDQGGLTDPRAGLSWECPTCRKDYDPGEYATAVRRDLLDRQHGADGWTHVTMAAESASTLVGMMVPASTVRKWMDRGKVAALCVWRPGVPWGVRLVFWPDVADEALAAVVRAREAQAKRARADAMAG